MSMLFNPYVLLGALVGLIVYTGAVWWKATSVANDHWRASQAAAVELARAEQEKKNAVVAAQLQAIVDEQDAALKRAEQETEELRDAIQKDDTDATVRVGPDLDRVFRRTLGIPDDAAAPPALGQ